MGKPPGFRILPAASQATNPANSQISDRSTNPEASFPPSIPAAGMYLHIAALSGDFGIGEIGASARRFFDTLADMHMHGQTGICCVWTKTAIPISSPGCPQAIAAKTVSRGAIRSMTRNDTPAMATSGGSIA
jgi:hypothetical protein